MILLLMLIHLVLALAAYGGLRAGRLHFASSLLPALFLLPLWGPMFALVSEMHYLGGEKADEEPESRRFDITDEVYRSINMESGSVSEIRPIEDVLETGTPVQRRRLLLSVLHSGARPFVRSLKTAGVNDDTEVVHYAVTALVELRSEYAQKLADMEEKYTASPSDVGIISEYAALDEEYIRSGIPEAGEKAERLAHCRMMLEKVLSCYDWQHTGRGKGAKSPASGSMMPSGAAFNGSSGDPQRISLLLRIGEVCLMQVDSDAAARTARALIEEAPAREDGYLMMIRAMSLSRDGKGIAGIIRKIREQGIYLSPSGREQVDFWEL